MTLEPIALVRAPDLAPDVPYAYAAVVEGRRLIFTAGACPLDRAGRVVAEGDVEAQAAQVMTNLAAALTAAGGDLSDVVRTTVYVASDRRQDLVAAWNVIRAGFGDHDPPSTLLGVTVLGYEHQLVEVEAIAVVSGRHPGRALPGQVG